MREMRRDRYKDPRLIVALPLIPCVMPPPRRTVPRFFMVMRRIKFFSPDKGAKDPPFPFPASIV